MEVLSAAYQGLFAVFQPLPFALMMVGVILGNIIGILPGLGAGFMLAVLIPFVFGMEPVAGIALLLGAHSVTGTGGSITSILFNTPGESANAPTCFDGFAMTQKGQPGRAMGAALYSSGVGGVIGALSLIVVIPILRPLILTFGPPEFFMLTVLGISFIASLETKSPLKGLMLGLFGLSLSLFGEDASTGVVRYNFGSIYLYEGMKQIPVVLGIFAVAEMIDLGVKGTDLVTGNVEVKDSVWQGIRDVHRHWWLTLKCSVIAVYIGFLPGLGGVASAFFTYGYAQRISKNPETFGKGNVEGVIAPEAANNAKEGGALIPTIGFGIPGSTGMALMLGAFLILGITPGPKMLNEHLPVVFAMAWTVAIANIIGAGQTLLLARHMAKLVFVRTGILIPLILAFVAMGSYSTSSSMGDLITTLVFGILGYFMKIYGYQKAPMVLGLVLGRLAESNFNISYDLYQLGFFLRPITALVTVLVIWSLLGPLLKTYRKKGEEVKTNAAVSEAEHKRGELILAFVFLAYFAVLCLVSTTYGPQARRMPLVVLVPGVVLAAVAVFREMKKRRAAPETKSAASPGAAEKKKIAIMIGWVFLLVAMIWILGFLVTLPIYTLLYMRATKESWRLSILMAVSGFVVLYFLFVVLINMELYPGLMFKAF